MEKNMKKNIYIYTYIYIYIRIYICITESLCCITEIKHNIGNQLYFNKIFLKKNQYYLRPAKHCARYLTFID